MIANRDKKYCNYNNNDVFKLCYVKYACNMYGGIHFFSLNVLRSFVIYIYNDKSNNESKEREVMLYTHTHYFVSVRELVQSNR